jgi:uncharacterized Zn finger protein
MSEIPYPVTEVHIRELATEQSFDRGVSYYRGGALFELVRRETELRACCSGSSYEPYRVSATLGPQGIVTTWCTCPYDWGGICKHRVALLLAWIHEPDTFHFVPPLDGALGGRSKQELIALIKEMLKREPDLARLLELPLQPGSQAPLDLDAFRRQITYALRHDYPNAAEVEVELDAIADTAASFLASGDWAKAGALYHLVMGEILPQYQELYDEDGHVAAVVGRCAQGLDSCFFEGDPDAETRRAWLEVLLEAKIKDVEMGGIDLAYSADELVLGHATDEEWPWIEARVRQVIASCQDDYSRWRRDALVRFLVRRLELADRDAEVDDLIFELGSSSQRAFLLVKRGRFDEAVAIAQQQFTGLPGLIIDFANALVEARAGPTAVTYVSGLLENRRGTGYLDWLARYAQKTGDLVAALDWWRRSFQQSPNLKAFHSLQEVANRLDLWERVRSELLEELDSRRDWSLLIAIALDEGNVARALDLLPHAQGWYSANHELRVAKAAEADYPQAALNIYHQRVERLISNRGRGNYQAAALLLCRVRDLYSRQQAHGKWRSLIADLRQRYRRLPALQDELNKAGL